MFNKLFKNKKRKIVDFSFDKPINQFNISNDNIEKTYDYKLIRDVKDLQFFYNGWFKLCSKEMLMVEEALIEMFRTKSTIYDIRLFNHKQLHHFYNTASYGKVEIISTSNKVCDYCRIKLNVDFDILTKAEHRFVLNKMLGK